MRVPTDIVDVDFPGLLGRFIDITGPEPWAKKFAWLRQELADNPFMEEWLLERHGIEAMFQELLAAQNESEEFPLQIRHPLQYELYGFVGAATRIYDELTAAGKKRLQGMILDGLKTDKGLLSLRHEVSTAVHLMQRGFDVEFHDIETGTGVDFIARRGDTELEVECKTFTGDIGRKCHKRRVVALHNRLFARVEQVFQSSSRGILIRVTIPDRLTGNLAQLSHIEEAVAKALVAGTAPIQTAYCTVQVKHFNVSDSPFNFQRVEHLSREMVAEFTQAQLGVSNPNLMVLVAPGKRAVICLIESAKPDEVLKGMRRQLREAAADQFTGSRPDILVVQFRDLTANQLLRLANSESTVPGKATGLQLMTSELLSSESRGHIHTVAYLTTGEVSHSQDGAISERGPVYLIRNRNHPRYDDPACQIFH